MKKILLSFVIALMCLFAIPSSKADAAAKLNKTKATVYVGNQTKLTVKGTKKKVTWKTSNSKVLTVKNGKITAKKQGTAVVTAKVGSKKYKCKVTVKNQAINQKNVTLNKGKTTKVKVNGAYKKVTYKSSNPKVATVSKYGDIKAIGAGTATITARHNGKNYTCKITVKDNSLMVLKLEKEVVNDKETQSITNGYLKQLTVKSKRSDSKFVYYTVTKTSYNALMNNIKKQLNNDTAKAIKDISLIKKVTYSSDCTKMNIYVDLKLLEGLFEEGVGEEGAEGDEAEFDKAMEALEPVMMEIMYYQLFSGKLTTQLKFKINVYDAASNTIVFSTDAM